MASPQSISCELQEGLAKVKLHRSGQLNVLNPEVYREMEKRLVELAADPGVKVILILGSQKVFGAGADLSYISNCDVSEICRFTDQAQRVNELLADLPKPTIAGIAGYALGGGLELALCCDFRIAADNAVFGLPEIDVGLIPGAGGTQRLPRLVGATRAAAMLFLGERIDAVQAESWGLVNRVVPLAQLESECEKLARILMSKPAVALRAAKTSMQTGLNVGLKEGLKIEQGLFCMLFGTEDRKEGVTAFMEKRKAVFKGR